MLNSQTQLVPSFRDCQSAQANDLTPAWRQHEATQPHDQNERQANGLKKTEAITSPIHKQGFRTS